MLSKQSKIYRAPHVVCAGCAVCALVNIVYSRDLQWSTITLRCACRMQALKNYGGPPDTLIHNSPACYMLLVVEGGFGA